MFTLFGGASAFFFFKIIFSQISFSNTIKLPYSLDQDQARHFVRPDLGPNCRQVLSADDTSRQRDNCLDQTFLVSLINQLKIDGQFFIDFVILSQNCLI